MARGFARGLHFVLEYRNTHVQGRMAGGMPAHAKRQSERNPESSSRLVIVGIGQFARVKLRLEPKEPAARQPTIFKAGGSRFSPINSAGAPLKSEGA